VCECGNDEIDFVCHVTINTQPPEINAQHIPLKLVSWGRIPNGACGLSGLVLGVNEWVQDKASRCAILACHRFTIYCESNRMAYGAE